MTEEKRTTVRNLQAHAPQAGFFLYGDSSRNLGTTPKSLKNYIWSRHGSGLGAGGPTYSFVPRKEFLQKVPSKDVLDKAIGGLLTEIDVITSPSRDFRIGDLPAILIASPLHANMTYEWPESPSEKKIVQRTVGVSKQGRVTSTKTKDYPTFGLRMDRTYPGWNPIIHDVVRLTSKDHEELVKLAQKRSTVEKSGVQDKERFESEYLRLLKARLTVKTLKRVKELILENAGKQNGE